MRSSSIDICNRLLQGPRVVCVGRSSAFKYLLFLQGSSGEKATFLMIRVKKEIHVEQIAELSRHGDRTHRTLIEAHRTPSISALRHYVYKYVYIYFLAAGQARAVGSLESGNLMVYGPLSQFPASDFYRRVHPRWRCIHSQM